MTTALEDLLSSLILQGETAPMGHAKGFINLSLTVAMIGMTTWMHWGCWDLVTVIFNALKGSIWCFCLWWNAWTLWRERKTAFLAAVASSNKKFGANLPQKREPASQQAPHWSSHLGHWQQSHSQNVKKGKWSILHGCCLVLSIWGNLDTVSWEKSQHLEYVWHRSQRVQKCVPCTSWNSHFFPYTTDNFECPCNIIIIAPRSKKDHLEKCKGQWFCQDAANLELFPVLKTLLKKVQCIFPFTSSCQVRRYPHKSAQKVIDNFSGLDLLSKLKMSVVKLHDMTTLWYHSRTVCSPCLDANWIFGQRHEKKVGDSFLLNFSCFLSDPMNQDIHISRFPVVFIHFHL